MKILYIFSKPGQKFKSIIRSHKGFYAVNDHSSALFFEQTLFGQAGWQELPRQLSFDFAKELRVFVSSLNELNASIHWWRLNFTDKNPLASEFFGQVFFFLRIVEAFSANANQPILVVTKDDYLIGQMKAWAKRENIKVINYSRPRLKWLIKQFTPVGPLYSFFRALIRHCSDIFFLTKKNSVIYPKTKKIVFASLINQASFKGQGYKDLYFEPLLAYLRDIKTPYLIFSLILKPYHNCVKNLSKLLTNDFITINQSVSFVDLVKCFWENLRRFYSSISWLGINQFRGVDISLLIRSAIKEDICSTKYFTNSLFYNSALCFFSRIRPEHFIYPFEMHPWEKMMLIALREICPKAVAVGYQHVALTPRHLNLIFSQKEKDLMPFPDRVVTLGEITREIIVKNNCFLKAQVISGCALRQSPCSSRVKSTCLKKSKGLNVAVIMASSVQEHIGLVKLANDCARLLKGRCRFFLRSHPTIDLNQVINQSGGLVEGCERSSGQLVELLQMSDLVMYTSSTVAIEALSFGRPVIYADLGDLISPDPLYDYDGMVSRITSSADFSSSLSCLENMTDQKFSDMINHGIEYANKYFIPVNHSNLEVFLKKDIP
ncbi:MAG: hypothetical protein PHV17_02420 [Candidatus Omnitrophica bacterium]|nr:hypothetical protein [Candidatus Omnitrophota bacterium]